MIQRNRIIPAFVEYIPDSLEPGVIYISRRYSTASHLCCCGCGLEVVTPLKPAKWRLAEHAGTISLNPSVGNWSFPCQSHYWIEGNRVFWAGAMSATAIDRVRVRDRRDAAFAVQPLRGWAAIRAWSIAQWQQFRESISDLWKR
jgi:hypothetical protein